MQPVERIREQVARMRELTEAPFAVNHTVRPLSEEAFALTLELAPRVVSLALGDPGELVARSHDAGVLFMQQVHSVEQARRAAAVGVDVIVAQGSEAGGFGGTVSTMALVPQVVDAVSPTAVVAAGGIADGRGVAAALALGAEGVNIGTRFLAAAETTIPDEWKQAIIAAESQDAVRVEFANDVFPSPGPEGYDTLPRVLRTPFVDEWNGRPEVVRAEAEPLTRRAGRSAP
jgi:enoyl-[acyl-carrier protein] reductase II